MSAPNAPVEGTGIGATGARPDHSLWPAVTSADPLALRRWLVDLGFVEGILVPGEGGEVEHSEMLWPEGGRLMVHSGGKESPDFTVPVGSQVLYVVTAEPDAVYTRAQALSAPLVRDLTDEDYGSRGFSIRDPEGNVWSFGTYAG